MREIFKRDDDWVTISLSFPTGALHDLAQRSEDRSTVLVGKPKGNYSPPGLKEGYSKAINKPKRYGASGGSTRRALVGSFLGE